MQRYRIIHTPFYYFTLLSLVILLVIGGAMVLLFFVSGKLDTTFREQVKLIVELDDVKQQRGVTNVLKQNPGVLPTSVKWISKEEALDVMRREMGEDVIFEDMPNPFLDIIQFQVRAEYLNRDSLDNLEQEIENSFSGTDLQFPKTLFGDTQQILKKMSLYVSLALIILLVLVTILMHHLMRLNVIANRFMIHTMQMVGATPGFIRRPFLTEAFKLAVFATVLAGVVLSIIWYWISSQIGMIKLDLPIQEFAMTLVMMLVACILVCGYSTFTALARRLAASQDDLY